jgi:hypothetical protein
MKIVPANCNGTFFNGPEKRFARCAFCGAIDYERYEGDAHRAAPRAPVPVEFSRLLSERRVDSGTREGSVTGFMNAIGTLTRPQARAKLATNARLHRWNAATQGAILRAMRAHYEGSGR